MCEAVIRTIEKHKYVKKPVFLPETPYRASFKVLPEKTRTSTL
jgi:hypothetical protein